MEKTEAEAYGKSKDGNFYVKDTIGVPHPYCITPKHLEFNEGMYLDIEQAEEKSNGKACCDICRNLKNERKQDKILTFAEHKQALLIACKKDIKDNSELKEYLLSIKDKTEKKGYVGFAFLDER